MYDIMTCIIEMKDLKINRIAIKKHNNPAKIIQGTTQIDTIYKFLETIHQEPNKIKLYGHNILSYAWPHLFYKLQGIITDEQELDNFIRKIAIIDTAQTSLPTNNWAFTSLQDYIIKFVKNPLPQDQQQNGEINSLININNYERAVLNNRYGLIPWKPGKRSA